MTEKGEIVVSGYGRCILNEREEVELNRENRRTMRFARRSGRMFISALSQAVKMSGYNIEEGQKESRGVFYGEFMNLMSDEDHRKELFDLCKNKEDRFDGGCFFHGIVDYWSTVEVLQDVPNIPCFLGAQITKAGGPSETIMANCASGIYALKAATDALNNNEIDVAFVGAASAKNDPLEKEILNARGYFRNGDYAVVDGAAAMVLERRKDLEARGGTVMAEILDIRSSFCGGNGGFQGKGSTVLEDMVRDSAACLEGEEFLYISGSISKRHVAGEIAAVSKIMGQNLWSEGYKDKKGYTFAASGLLEIIGWMESSEKNPAIIATFGYGGNNGCVVVR
ncbi:MAG: beta-ketoacyl synthase N-terminal-like domain-containing protein [Anaerovoracaceae bacterium]|jgi:hypothetical protein